jgi:hypothetical protein
MDKLTFTDVLRNPAGKGSANVGRRSSIIDDLSARAGKLFKRKEPELTIYEDGDSFIFHFIIPSEEETYNIKYDVVLKFSPQTEEDKDLRSVSEYGMEMFSNSPAFTFTYAYVTSQNNWLLTQLRDKISKLALTQAPKERNPGEQFGYEKSIFFSMLAMKEYSLNLKSRFDKYMPIKKAINWRDFSKTIKSSDEKLKEYGQAKSKALVAKKKAQAKAKPKRPNQRLSQVKKRPKTRSKSVLKPKKAIKQRRG